MVCIASVSNAKRLLFFLLLIPGQREEPIIMELHQRIHNNNTEEEDLGRKTFRRNTVTIAELARGQTKTIPEERSVRTTSTASLPFLAPLHDTGSTSSGQSAVSPASSTQQSSQRKRGFRFPNMFGFVKTAANNIVNINDPPKRTYSRRGNGSNALKEYDTPSSARTGRKMRLLRSNSALHDDEVESDFGAVSDTSSHDPSL